MKAISKRRDKTRKNTLLLIWEKIAYLNFINTCQNEFNEHIKKYVQYFAIFY